MSSIARKAPMALRILLGLTFFVFGLNGFLHFLPNPPPPAAAGAFAGAMLATGYMFPLVKGVEVIAGTLLLANRFVPLALVLLAPNIVNILLFHAFLAPSGVVIALIVLALELYLAWQYRDVYRPMLAARAEPAGASKGGAPAPAHASA
jgi:uncharacterized membrane protein YphA (DoxX/SURF4 family)